MRAILFDYGGTLDSDGLTWLDRFYPLYKEAGLSSERADFARAFYDSDDTLPARHDLKPLGLRQTLELQVARVVEQLAPGQSRIQEKVVSDFLADCRAAFARNRPVLERLRRKHRLGIVSNFYGNLDACLRSEGLRDLFDCVADSGAVGSSKPEPAIFQHALKALDAGPDEALMVGDSIPRDMRGAEGLGMPHALIGGGASCCGQAWRLTTLADLEARLS